MDDQEDIVYKSTYTHYDPYWQKDNKTHAKDPTMGGLGRKDGVTEQGLLRWTAESNIDKAVAKLMRIVNTEFNVEDPDWSKMDNTFKIEDTYKAGKWEMWSYDVAAAIVSGFERNQFGKRMYYDYYDPNDNDPEFDMNLATGVITDEITINTGSCLYLNAGRGIGPLSIFKSGLAKNKGIFDKMVAVEHDPMLSKRNQDIVTEFGLEENYKCVNIMDLSPPDPMPADFEEHIFNKKFDVIILALPPSNSEHGIYIQNQRRRAGMSKIAAHGGKPIDTGFLGKIDMYDNIDEFKVRHYDENWSRHKAAYKNAYKFLNPGGVVISIHNQFMSDIEAFNPYIEEGNMEIFTHDYMDQYRWKFKSYALFLTQYCIPPSWIDPRYFITSKLKD